ncbi:MAG: metal ABC transporter permease [Acidimicrobiales bacterium]
MRWITDPYQSSFMIRALGAVLLIGAFSPMVGVWVVLRRMSYLGDAMSHSLLAGVAASFLLGVSINLGALAAGLAMATLMSLLALHPRLHADAVIGVVETGLFGIGLVLVSLRSDRIGYDLSHFLLGQISTTTTGDLLGQRGPGGYGGAGAHREFWRPARRHLRPRPCRPGRGQNWAVVLAAAESPGGGHRGQPANCWRLDERGHACHPASHRPVDTNRLVPMTLAAMAVGVSAGVIGLTSSYHLETPPGATISLTSVALLLITIAVSAFRSHRVKSAKVETPAPALRQDLSVQMSR